MVSQELFKRKYQVFISSTFEDLREHRQRAILGITRAGHMPVALENFAPSTDTKKQVIRQALEASQFYVIILGARYGTIAEGASGKSYVEIELDLARELGLKILAFVMDHKRVLELRESEIFQKSDEARLVPQYEALRERLTSGIENLFYKPFDDPREIEMELYAYFSAEHPEQGYILEPQKRSDTEILEIYARNEIIRDVVKRLVQFETVEPRLATEAEKKIAVAKAFADLWGDYVQDKFNRIFLESGSTITYVAKALMNYLPHKWQRGVGTEVITNNAFAYLYLWLYSEVLCRPVPSGPPDNKYGGMYGELAGRKRAPTYDLSPLGKYDPEAPAMIERLCNDIFGDLPTKKTLILAAISGVQVSKDDINAVILDHEGNEKKLAPTDPLWQQVSQCRGFHVGSYENRLFKRCFYLTNYPTIVFIHDSKIDCKVIVGKCHFLFDAEYTWEDFIRNHPLSLWVACSEKSYREIFVKFTRGFTEAAGWTCGVYGLGTPFPIVIGYNRPFKESCREIKIELPVLPINDSVSMTDKATTTAAPNAAQPTTRSRSSS